MMLMWDASGGRAASSGGVSSDADLDVKGVSGKSCRETGVRLSVQQQATLISDTAASGNSSRW